jgi:hypothetical protein
MAGYFIGGDDKLYPRRYRYPDDDEDDDWDTGCWAEISALRVEYAVEAAIEAKIKARRAAEVEAEREAIVKLQRERSKCAS